MHLIDWFILACFAAALLFISLYTKTYTKSVSDFLIANRCAGRYLLSIAQGEAGFGAITVIAAFEMYYKAGFTAYWWTIPTFPLGVFIGLSGWVIYRYRETRVMTVAQLFGIRYGSRFRVFCGILIWITGVVNMGIFPAVTANFFIYFCRLPEVYNILGFEFSTFVTIMLIEISIALFFTFLGGMLVVLVTDFLQGIFSNIVFLVLLIFLFINFNWSQISEAVVLAPKDASLINPYHTANVEGFNIYFFLIQAFITFYTYRAWQGTQGYNAAARNPHEAKMSNLIGLWRGITYKLLIMMVPICIFTLLNHTDFISQAQRVFAIDHAIADKQIQVQMLVPLGLAEILKPGLLGLFAAMMFAAAISTDDTYLHSWGSVFIQDVILPFRKKEFTPKQHIWLLRVSILFVALLIFLFSLFFRQTDFIMMYMYLTGAIYLGGAGVVLIGGLYWKRGSTLGAWCGMVAGSFLAGGGLIIKNYWTELVPLLEKCFHGWEFLAKHPDVFPYDGMQINFFAVTCAITAYVLGSSYSWLVLRQPAFNIERMLHRGKYAIKGEHKVAKIPVGLKTLLPDKEFNIFDKIIHLSITVWFLGWFVFFVIVTIYHFVCGTTESWWLGFWKFKVWLIFIIGIITTIWFFVGGIFDFKYLFKALKSEVIDPSDNGRTIDEKTNGTSEDRLLEV